MERYSDAHTNHAAQLLKIKPTNLPTRCVTTTSERDANKRCSGVLEHIEKATPKNILFVSCLWSATAMRTQITLLSF